MALDGSWIEELERASAQVHILRLEALEIHIRQQAEELHANSQQALFNSVKDIYTYDYYHAAFELATGVGFGVRLQPINDYQLDIYCAGLGPRMAKTSQVGFGITGTNW